MLRTFYTLALIAIAAIRGIFGVPFGASAQQARRYPRPAALLEEDEMEWEFQVWQDGVMVACGSGANAEDVESEARSYFYQYSQYGPCRIIFGRPPLPAPPEKT